MSLQGPQGSNTLDADWEEQQAPSTPVMQLSTGLSRRKALGIDMSVSAEKTARATLFTVPAHTSPNIYIFKLSLRGKLLQTLSCSDKWELCWGGMPWDSSALALNHVTSQMPLPLGGCFSSASTGWQELTFPSKHGLWGTHGSPKPPGLIPWMLHPRPGCVGQHEPAQVWKPGCPAAGVCASTPWPALFSPRAGDTASPHGWGRCQLWPGLPPGADSPVPVKGGGSVCWGRGSACVLSHGQPAPSGLGSKAASTSQPPTISKELSSLLQSKSKQNTTTDAVCKTKPYLSWDLRTHTKFPASGRASGGTTTVNGYISGGAKELWGQPDFG